MFFRGDIDVLELTGKSYVECIGPDFSNLDSSLLELGNQSAQMVRGAAGYSDVATSDRASYEEGASFNAVGNDGVLGSIEFFDALHADGRGARPFDTGT